MRLDDKDDFGDGCSMTEAAWAIVRTRSRCEDIVERGFLCVGYRAYIPRFRMLTYPHGQKRKPSAVMRPLFAGIVFVQDWRGWPKEPIGQVIGLMPWSLNGSHAALGGADIAILMDRERSGVYEPHAPRPPANGVVIPGMEIGNLVEYELAGQAIAAVIKELSKDGQAKIGAMVFGREITLKVPAGDLRIVSA